MIKPFVRLHEISILNGTKENENKHKNENEM